MKKGLIAGGILLGCVLLLSGIAAADISTSGKVEFKISGDPAGLFGGAVEGKLSTSFSTAADSWSGGLTAEIKNQGATLNLKSAYIKYTAEMVTLKMEPLGVDYKIYDLGCAIGKNPGLTLSTAIDPLTITGVVNNVDSGTNGVDWGYGIGAEYAADAVTVGARYNSLTAYGVKIVGKMAPITLTGQYAGYNNGMGYIVKGVYALSTGTVTASYTAKNAAFTGAAATTVILGELAGIPVTGTTTLKLKATSTDNVLTLLGETVTTLAEKVKLTINVTSAAGALTYWGKIGVSF